MKIKIELKTHDLQVILARYFRDQMPALVFLPEDITFIYDGDEISPRVEVEYES